VAHLDRPVRTASYLSLLRSLDVNSPGPCTETEKSPVPSAPTNTG
jgi:hypothetical protein